MNRVAGKARERKEPRNTRNRTPPWGKELPHPVHIFRAFPSTLTKGAGHFRFAYYELKEAVGTSFRYMKGITMGCWQLPMKNDRQDEWSLPQTLWPWWLSAIRQCLETNDVLDVHLLRGRCEAGTTTSIARRACDLVGCVRRVGSTRVVGWEMRSKKKKRKKKREEKKGKRGGQRFGECFFPMKRCAIATEENKGRTRMSWMRLFRLLHSLLVSEIRLCGQMFLVIIWDTRFFQMVKWFSQEKWRICYDVRRLR